MGDNLELIEDISRARKDIEECIKKNGFAAEHNFCYYQWLEENNRKNIFLKFSGKRGIFAQYNAKLNVWYFISMPIAQEPDRERVLIESLEFLFKKKKARKVMLELTTELKAKLTSKLKNSGLRVGSNNFVYYWPVFEMKSWDGDKLKGKKWKKMRNIRNRFYKLNKVVVKNSRELPSEKLNKIVDDWINKRSNIDRPLYHRYLNMIKQNFNGADFTRSLVVNDEPCSITAGWKIPNSNDYYSGVGIYNYRISGIGEVANIDDLIFLKKKEFDKIDFGGSGKTLLQFKKKFHPSLIYKTYSFPIVRK